MPFNPFKRKSDDAAHRQVVGQQQHQGSGSRSADSKHGVAVPDHRHVHHHPGRIEERDQTVR